MCSQVAQRVEIPDGPRQALMAARCISVALGYIASRSRWIASASPGGRSSRMPSWPAVDRDSVCVHSSTPYMSSRRRSASCSSGRASSAPRQWRSPAAIFVFVGHPQPPGKCVCPNYTPRRGGSSLTRVAAPVRTAARLCDLNGSLSRRRVAGQDRGRGRCRTVIVRMN